MAATAARAPRYIPPAVHPIGWARQALGTFIAAQKILLDLTAQQNALAIGIARERLKRPRIHPGRSAAKLTRKSVTGLTAAGKVLLDLTAGETALFAESVKESMSLPPAAIAVTDVFCHRVDTLVEDMKNLLDATSTQIQAMVDSYLEGKGLLAGATIGELVRRGILAFVETEKKFLDLVADEVNAAVEMSKVGRKPSRERGKAMTKLARQAVEEFIEAQKKLLELTIHQFETNGKPAEKPEEAMEQKKTTWAEVTQKSVQNLVTAQKSLMDLAVKPIKHPKPGAPAAKRAMSQPAAKARKRSRTRAVA